MFSRQKRRKLDQYLHHSRKDPETALQEMTLLSNRMWKLLVGIVLTTIFLALLLPASGWRQVVSLGVLLSLLNGLGWLAVLRIQPELFERSSSFNQLVMLLLLTVGVSKGIFLLGWSPFLAPIPVLAMISGMLFKQSVSLLVVAGLGLYLSLMSPRLGGKGVSEIQIDYILAISLILGGIVSVCGVFRVRQQSQPTLVGCLAGLIQVLTVITFQVGDPEFDYRQLHNWNEVQRLLVNPGWAFMGGMVSGGLVTIFLPAIERLFDIITERRLLALSDPNTDLLKTLRNRAPGTYQHTLGVAQLSSAASEAIGADPLLCQVGAYYHDIGKIVKPEYFVENMGENKSIHSRLRPSMSKLIIISHVKEGVELAREDGLPEKIVDMIPMHHGTTVVEYFFHKARELSDGESPEIESEYRYPGPKPRFQEAGILMLADTMEAVAKTIAEPSHARFQSMAHEIIQKRLLDGQLDECNLTMRDLKRIEESFARTLTNMYHARIRYPSDEVKGEEEPPAPAAEKAEKAEKAENENGRGAVSRQQSPV